MFRVFLLGFSVCIWLCCAQFASAVTYEFTFDDIDDGANAPPYVGFGVLSFDGPSPGDGSFAYESFSNLDLQFQFSAVANSFTQADAITPLSEVLLVFSENGRNLRFSNVNQSGSGEFTGALDFLREDAMRFGLSTEPPGTNGNLDRYFLGIFPADPSTQPPDPIHFGNYRGQLVPEPNSTALSVAGFAMMCMLLRSGPRRVTSESAKEELTR